jgi:hypothetical protein
MERPCKNCNQLLKKHCLIGGPSFNAANWCFPDTGTNCEKDSMFYIPLSNLEYLEYLYDKKTV